MYFLYDKVWRIFELAASGASFLEVQTSPLFLLAFASLPVSVSASNLTQDSW